MPAPELCTECDRVRIQGGHCLAHLTHSERAREIERLRRGERLNAGRAAISQVLLESLLDDLRQDPNGRVRLPSVDFGEAQFSGHADFSGAQFSGEADFSGAQFSGEADFSGAQFSGEADFSGAQFSGEADFRGTTFEQDVTVKDATFKAAVSQARLESVLADFAQGPNGRVRLPSVDFGKAQFSGETDFRGTTFERDVDFKEATFKAAVSQARLESVLADLVQDPYGRVRLPSVDFGEAQFSGDADFTGAQFAGVAEFRGTRFGQEVDFKEATFKAAVSQARLESVLADLVRDPSGRVRLPSVDFGEAQFSGDADFRSTTFERDVDFEDATFKAACHLGPMSTTGSLLLDGGVFLEHVRVVVRAVRLSAKRAEFRSGTDILAQSASIAFDHARFGAASTVSPAMRDDASTRR